MTEDELTAAEALCDGATPRPWSVMEHADWNVLCETGRRVVIASGNDLRDLGNPEDRNNAAFIAAARTLLPQALAEVRRLQGQLGRTRQQRNLTEEAAAGWADRAEAAEAETARLRAALDKYGSHHDATCEPWQGGPGTCTCGLDGALGVGQ